jgi:hypothetical protein
MLRIADSLAYVAAARHVYFVADDAEVESRRLFVKAKNNLSPRETNSAAAVAAKMAQEGKSGHVGRLRVEVGRKSLTFFSFWPSSKTANMAKMPSGPVGHLPGSPCAGRGPRTVSPSVKRFETIPKKPAWYGGFMNGYSLDTRFQAVSFRALREW